MIYRIKAVDGNDPEVSEMIESMQRDYIDGPVAPTSYGHWWIAEDEQETVVAFAGMTPGRTEGYAYLCRAAVRPAHRGHGLQKRLIRVRERKARALGFHTAVSDTMNAHASANNLIACGYRLYVPQTLWSFNGALYWRKKLTA